MKLKDLLGHYAESTIDKAILDNLNTLLLSVQKLERLYGKPFIVTSGLRTKSDQIRIYAEKGITDINKIPMGSKHLSGQAVDISDPNFDLTNFCKANDCEVLKACGLYLENDTSVKRCHLQTVPPKSGNRVFNP